MYDAGANYNTPVPVLCALTLLWGLQIAWAWAVLRRCMVIEFSGDSWTISPSHGARPYTASLLQANYRSRWLLVLVFERKDGRRVTEAVWRGAVTAAIFSRLHLAAAYGCRSPTPKRTSAALRYTAEPVGQPTQSSMPGHKVHKA